MIHLIYKFIRSWHSASDNQLGSDVGIQFVFVQNEKYPLRINLLVPIDNRLWRIIGYLETITT